MRIITFIYALLFLSQISYSQDTKKVVQSKNNSTIEEFFVLKSDKSIKHGNYVKYSTQHSRKYFLEYGYYNHNIKSGIWLYFNSIHPKNPLSIIGEYNDGKRTGQWEYYYTSELKDMDVFDLVGLNNLTNIISTKNELQITIDTSDLKLAALGNFEKDQKVGEWKYFSRDGDLIKIYDFSNKKEIFSSSHDSINSLMQGGFSSFQDQLTQSLLENDNEIKAKPTSSLAFEIITNEGNLYVNNLTPLIENTFANLIEQAIMRMPRYWVDYDPVFEKFSFVVSFNIRKEEQGPYLDLKSFIPKYSK